MTTHLYKVTEAYECTDIISTGDYFGTQFIKSKSGYVRLIRDDEKRTYVIQLFLIQSDLTKINTDLSFKPVSENRVNNLAKQVRVIIYFTLLSIKVN